MQVLRTESAENDLDAIAGYYGPLNPTATLAILDRVADAEATLGEYPFFGRTGRVSGTREVVVVGTPFILVYTVSESSVTIIRVLHTRQKWPKS